VHLHSCFCHAMGRRELLRVDSHAASYPGKCLLSSSHPKDPCLSVQPGSEGKCPINIFREYFRSNQLFFRSLHESNVVFVVALLLRDLSTSSFQRIYIYIYIYIYMKSFPWNSKSLLHKYHCAFHVGQLGCLVHCSAV